MSLPTPTRRFFGGLLMGVGGLMALLCGLCALTFFTLGLASLFKGGEDGGYATVMIIISLGAGSIPVLAGCAVFMLGRRLRGDRPRPTPNSIWPPPSPSDDAP